MATTPLILLTGATGYVGGRLLKVLEKNGFRVRCLTRRPEHLLSRVAPATEVMAGDILATETLALAMQGVDVAYYMVHSMGAKRGFVEEDRRGACALAQAASEAHYLPGRSWK